jgi:hypothetical protein
LKDDEGHCGRSAREFIRFDALIHIGILACRESSLALLQIGASPSCFSRQIACLAPIDRRANVAINMRCSRTSFASALKKRAIPIARADRQPSSLELKALGGSPLLYVSDLNRREPNLLQLL